MLPGRLWIVYDSGYRRSGAYVYWQYGGEVHEARSNLRVNGQALYLPLILIRGRDWRCSM